MCPSGHYHNLLIYKPNLYSWYRKRLVLYMRFSETFQLYFILLNASICYSGGSVFPFMRYWIPISHLWNSLQNIVCCKLYLEIVIPLYHVRQHISSGPPIGPPIADKPNTPKEIMLYQLVLAFDTWGLMSSGNGGGISFLLRSIYSIVTLFYTELVERMFKISDHFYF